MPVRLLQTNLMKSKGKSKSPGRPLHFLKEWREFRHLTQEALAAAVGTSKSVISLIESGGRKLSDKWARRLAIPLKVRPGWLLDQDPYEMSTSILEVWGSIPEDQQAQAIMVLKTFVKKSQ